MKAGYILGGGVAAGLIIPIIAISLWGEPQPRRPAPRPPQQTEAEAWNAKAKAAGEQHAVDELLDATREVLRTQHELVFQKCLADGIETIERCAARAK